MGKDEEKTESVFLFLFSLLIYKKKLRRSSPLPPIGLKRRKREGYSISSPRFNVRVETVSILSFFHFSQALISRYLSFHTAARDVGELVSLHNIDPILQHVFKLNEV